MTWHQEVPSSSLGGGALLFANFSSSKVRLVFDFGVLVFLAREEFRLSGRSFRSSS